MPKKSPKQQREEARWIAWYKWEFLRRNPEYRRDHQGLMREFGSWFRKYGTWYDDTIPPWGLTRLQFFGRVIAPRIKAICAKWQIRDPFSPYWEFTKTGKHYYKRHYEVLIPTDCSKEEVTRLWSFPEYFFLSHDELEKRLPESTAHLRPPAQVLALRLDLRCSLSDLLAVAKSEITSRKQIYDRRHFEPTEIAAAVRHRMNLYDTYLKVWDMRNGGCKLEVIGAELFPRVPRRAQRASDSFVRAKALISSGYKELR